MILIQSTPASINWLVFALASAAPETFHVWTAFGFPPFVSAGPATYSVGPGISPLAMRFLTARIGCGGAARSRTVVTPAISICSADAGMMTRSNCGV